MKKCLFIILTLFINALYAQQAKLDSLLRVYKGYRSSCNYACLQDSSLVNLMDKISWELREYNVDSALLMAQKSLKQAIKIDWSRGAARGYTQVAICYKYLGKYDTALVYLDRSLKEWDIAAREPKYAHTSKVGRIKVFMQIGAVYSFMGNYIKALKGYEDGLAIALAIKDKKMQAGLYGNIGILYSSLGDYTKTLQYDLLSLKLAEELGEQRSVAINLSNIGYVHMNHGDYAKALEYFERALKMAEQLSDQHMLVATLNYLSSVHTNMQKIDVAEQYTLRSIKICEDLKDDYNLSYCLMQLASIKQAKGDFKSARVLAERSLECARRINAAPYISGALTTLAQCSEFEGNLKLAEKQLLESEKIAAEAGELEAIRTTAQTLSQLYKKMGNYRSALEYYQKFINIRDSVFSEDKNKDQVRMELKYEYDKKAAADSVRAEEDKKVVNLQLKQEKTQRYALYAGLSLVMLFAIFMVNRFVVIRKQKTEIEIQKKTTELQKHLIEEKQKEILDSIHYARRIQRSLITSERYIANALSRLRKN